MRLQRAAEILNLVKHQEQYTINLLTERLELVLVFLLTYKQEYRSEITFRHSSIDLHLYYMEYKLCIVFSVESLLMHVYVSYIATEEKYGGVYTESICVNLDMKVDELFNCLNNPDNFQNKKGA